MNHNPPTDGRALYTNRDDPPAGGLWRIPFDQKIIKYTNESDHHRG